MGWMSRGETNERKWLLLTGGRGSLPEPHAAVPISSLLHPPPASPAVMLHLLRRQRKTHLRCSAAETERLPFRSTLSIFTRWPQIKYTDIESRHTRRGKKKKERGRREVEEGGGEREALLHTSSINCDEEVS